MNLSGFDSVKYVANIHFFTIVIDGFNNFKLFSEIHSIEFDR